MVSGHWTLPLDLYSKLCELSGLGPREDRAATPPPPNSATAPVPGGIVTIITISIVIIAAIVTGARLAARRTLRPWESETHPRYPASSHQDSTRPRTLLPLRYNPGAIPVAPFQTVRVCYHACGHKRGLERNREAQKWQQSGSEENLSR